MKHKKSLVISKRILNGRYVELIFENNLEPFPSPGQFVHILTDATYIRRPFSIAGCTQKQAMILIQIKGPGTKKLSEIQKGMYLDIIGPLGNGFPDVKDEKNIYLVAGGIGIAPILFLMSKLLNENKKFKLFYGAKTKDDMLVSMLPEGKYEKILSTDDGSYGEKATVLETFEKVTIEEKPDIVFSSGPNEMLKKLSIFCKEKGIKAYISLENIMFCGTGICQGCVVDTKEGYKRVCKEGPVFDHLEIKWK